MMQNLVLNTILCKKIRKKGFRIRVINEFLKFGRLDI